MKISPLILLSLLAFHFGCFKPDEPTEPTTETLPAKTQEGKNTFGCYVNGKPFIKCCEPFDCSAAWGNGSALHVNNWLPNKLVFAIDADDRCNTDTSGIWESIDISFGIDSTNLSTYGIRGSYLALDGADNLCGNVNDDFRFHDSLSETNFIKIRFFNKTSKIISGDFQFDLFTPDCTDTVKIRDGRFDIKY